MPAHLVACGGCCGAPRMLVHPGPWHVHAAYLALVAGLLAAWRGRPDFDQPPESQGGADAGAAANGCVLRSISYSAPGLADVLAEHVTRNVPLRITGVPREAVADLGEASLALASEQVVELRQLGSKGHVPKRAVRRNFTFGEALAGAAGAGDWYAAQVSVPKELPQLLQGIPGDDVALLDGLNLRPLGVLSDQPNLSAVWWKATGKPLSASPYLYYYGGRRPGLAPANAHAGGDAPEPGPSLYIHYDAAENMVQMLDGWKEFWLYDPFQAAQLLYGNNKKYGNGSPVNPDSPNVSRDYPLFRFAEPRRCVISAGEWLYVPIYWWHRVRTAEARTVALTHWSGGDSEKKNVMGKFMCGYSLRPAAFECTS